MTGVSERFPINERLTAEVVILHPGHLCINFYRAGEFIGSFAHEGNFRCSYMPADSGKAYSMESLQEAIVLADISAIKRSWDL